MPPGTTHPPKKPLQPFVPVRPGGRKKLYSHTELRAFASMDPRNELDELSEPNRFKKDVTKPDVISESEARQRRGVGLLLGFLAGATVGAVLAALTTPKKGSQVRGWLQGRTPGN